MFERFSDQARRIVVQAQEEARRLRHNYIGTEHILLSIIREGEDGGVAADALRSLSVDLDALRREVEALIGQGEDRRAGHIPFTPQAKKTLELALRESIHLKSGYIGTEHILLGMIRVGGGVAGQVLTAHGAALEPTRQEVARLLESTGGERRLSEVSPRLRPRGGPTLEEIAHQLRTISQRLATIEDKLGIEKSPTRRRLRQIEAELERVWRQQETAVDQQDFERAAALREQEETLRASRREAEQAWLADQDIANPQARPPGEQVEPPANQPPAAPA